MITSRTAARCWRPLCTLLFFIISLSGIIGQSWIPLAQVRFPRPSVHPLAPFGLPPRIKLASSPMSKGVPVDTDNCAQEGRRFPNFVAFAKKGGETNEKYTENLGDVALRGKRLKACVANQRVRPTALAFSRLTSPKGKQEHPIGSFPSPWAPSSGWACGARGRQREAPFRRFRRRPQGPFPSLRDVLGAPLGSEGPLGAAARRSPPAAPRRAGGRLPLRRSQASGPKPSQRRTCTPTGGGTPLDFAFRFAGKAEGKLSFPFGEVQFPRKGNKCKGAPRQGPLGCKRRPGGQGCRSADLYIIFFNTFI